MCALIWPAGLLAPGDAAMVWNAIAPAASPTLILSDTFTDPDGTSLSSHTIAPVNTISAAWVRGYYAVSGIISNHACSSNGPGASEGYFDATIGDISVSMSYNPGAVPSLYAGAYVRIDNPAVGKGYFVSSGFNNRIAINEYTPSLVVRAYSAISITASQTYDLTVTVSGLLITATTTTNSGIVSTSYTMASNSGWTYAGFYITAQPTWIDDYKAYAL